jgi:hypothetical protein
VNDETHPVVVKPGGKVRLVETEVGEELCQPCFHLKS